jgi:uncharacterized protein (TIGR02284 family)
MPNENAVALLNHLIEKNSERINRLSSAANATGNSTLTKILNICIKTSQLCNIELSREVIALGGIPTQPEKNTASEFFSAWLDFENMLAVNDTESLLSCCLSADDLIIDAYERILKNDAVNLSSDQRSMVEFHKRALNADQIAMRELILQI